MVMIQFDLDKSIAEILAIIQNRDKDWVININDGLTNVTELTYTDKDNKGTLIRYGVGRTANGTSQLAYVRYPQHMFKSGAEATEQTMGIVKATRRCGVCEKINKTKEEAK